MKDTGILLVTICSNQKVQGGDAFKESAPSLCKCVPELADEMKARRAFVLGSILHGSTVRDGIKLSEMQFNSRLVKGPEFGGPKSGLFLPAAERYVGSFYSTVHRDMRDILVRSPHHILIVSALYGLLLPEELIQAYSCHIEDHPDLSANWKKSDFLTSVLAAYVKRFKIRRVFDLTAQDSYRLLVDWERISSKADVLHAFGEQYAGPILLSSLGEFARDHLLLASEESALAYKDGERVFIEREKLVLTSKPYPPEGFPREATPSGAKETYTSEPNLDFDSRNTDNDEVHVLDHPRDINVTSKGHNTIFEIPIDGMNDLPAEVKREFEAISRCPDVLEVFFKQREKGGRSASSYRLKIFSPQAGTGYIHAKLEGAGSVCHTQDISIRVTKNREAPVFLVLKRLLDGESEV